MTTDADAAPAEARIRRFVSRPRVRAGETGGLHSVLEHALPPGIVAMPPHRHAAVAVTLWVTDGELWVRAGGRERALRPGDHATAAPGEWLAFWTRGGEGAPGAVFLAIAAPGGLERYYEEVAALVAAGPIDIDRVVETGARHGVEVDLPGLLDLIERYAVHLA